MNQKTVMLVDGLPGFRFSVSLTLKTRGFNIIEASDGSEALELIAGRSLLDSGIDLVICDLAMQSMNELAFLEEMLVRRDQGRVIIISGYSSRDATEKIRKMGYNCIIEKPFSAEVLIHWVNSILNQ